MDRWLKSFEGLPEKIFSISSNHDIYKITIPEKHGYLLKSSEIISKPDVIECSVVTVINANEKICGLIPKLIKKQSKFEIYDFDYDRGTHTARFAVSPASLASFIRLIHSKIVY